jgi:hypothetical protein
VPEARDAQVTLAEVIVLTPEALTITPRIIISFVFVVETVMVKEVETEPPPE